MFENKTLENLMLEKMRNVPTDVDKREGSVIYDAMAPNALETAKMYQELDAYYKETFGSTASRTYLIERCRERGISPKQASPGTYKGEFNAQIPIGNRFTLRNFIYKIVKYIGFNSGSNYHEYELLVETEGSLPNSNFGRLIPVEYIQDLSYAYLTETLIPGENEEDTENLRKRYLSSFDVQAFGGNIKDYEEKTLAIPGVGAVKVTPVWNGGGTVKLTILDSEFNVASNTLIDIVQERIDPFQNHEGIGIAPIGHVVTVETAKETSIIITTTLYLSGIELGNVKYDIDNALENYFIELRKTFGIVEPLTVRISQIESRILSVSNKIVDIKNTKINGIAENYIIETYHIPVFGGAEYVTG